MDLTIPAFLVSATAVAASVVAAAVGLQQLLSGPRLRHMESLLREAVQATDNAHQQRVLRSMHSATIGRVIAREAVPGLLFLMPGLQIGMAFSAAVAVGLRYPGEWRVGALFTFALFGWFGVRQGTRLVGERLRVARAYEHGDSTVRAYTDTLAKMEGGRRWEIWLSLITSASIVLAAARAASSFRVDEVGFWLHFIPVLGGFMTAGAALSLAWTRLKLEGTVEPRNREDTLKPLWAHPRGVFTPSPTQHSALSHAERTPPSATETPLSHGDVTGSPETPQVVVATDETASQDGAQRDSPGQVNPPSSV